MEYDRIIKFSGETYSGKALCGVGGIAVNPRRSVMGIQRARDKPSFLLLLYGTLEYDGRAQRMVETLTSLGNVTVVDVAYQGPNQIEMAADMGRISVCLPRRAVKVERHWRFWWTALRAAYRMSLSVVVAENYFTTVPAWLLARLRRAKLIYDAYELIVPEPRWTMNKRDYFWYLMERWTVRRADLVIAANEERVRVMAEHYRLKQMPGVVQNIPANYCGEAKKEDVLGQFPALARRMPNEILVLYQGNISFDRGISRFVEAMRQLSPRYRLVIVGDGPDLNNLKKQAKTLEEEGRFVALGRVPHKLLPAITRLADIGIVTYPVCGLNNIYCASNKIFEYAQAGLPVVATNQPPLYRLVERYGIGKLISENDSSKQVAKIIDEVAENKPLYAEALARFLKDHRWEIEAERVRVAILKVLNKSEHN